MRAIAKKRDHNLRMYLILMIFCFEMEMFVNVGEGSTYLYLRRTLEFTMSDYTRYSTVVGVIGIVAQYVTIPILSERLKLHDSTIILIDIGGCFIQTVILACIQAEWMLYLGAIIACLDATSFTMIRCMITKHVDPDEVGKLLSVVGAFQSFIPILGGPLFGLLYKHTVETLPQAFLIVLAFFFAIDFFTLVFINRGTRRIAKVMAAVEMQDIKSIAVKQELLNEKNETHDRS